jgi:hypothetical protein
MTIRIVSCGVNWWAMHSKDLSDPFCFRKNACWLNSTGLMFGRRRRDCHIVRGQIRFNRISGFNPEFVNRIGGETYHSPGPRVHEDKIHLLFDLPAIGEEPDAYLATLTESRNGEILFRKSSWRSETVRPISISKQHDRYEAMVLLTGKDWIKTSRGSWGIAQNGRSLELKENLHEI